MEQRLPSGNLAGDRCQLRKPGLYVMNCGMLSADKFESENSQGCNHGGGGF